AELRVYFSINVAQGVFRPFTPMGAQAFRLISAGMAGLAGYPQRDPAAGMPALVEAAQRLFFDVTPLVRSPRGRRLFAAVTQPMEARTSAVLERLSPDPRLSASHSTGVERGML